MKKKIHMLVLAIICLGCNGQIKTDVEFSEKEKDSISNIIDNLYGNWFSADKEILELNENGIYNCYMTIDECLILLDIEDNTIGEFGNRICIEEIIWISERPINSPKLDFVHINLLIKKHYLPDSFEIAITKKNNAYGFLYPTEMNSMFLPIKFLNDNSLILKDGREFKKIR